MAELSHPFPEIHGSVFEFLRRSELFLVDQFVFRVIITEGERRFGFIAVKVEYRLGISIQLLVDMLTVFEHLLLIYFLPSDESSDQRLDLNYLVLERLKFFQDFLVKGPRHVRRKVYFIGFLLAFQASIIHASHFNNDNSLNNNPEIKTKMNQKSSDCFYETFQFGNSARQQLLLLYMIDFIYVFFVPKSNLISFAFEFSLYSILFLSALNFLI